MGKIFGAASTVAALGTIFFVVGATTGPAGMTAIGSYAGTIGTGVVNTGHGLAYAASGGAEVLSNVIS